MTLSREQMERTIRTYFDGCNGADPDKMRRCFAPDAVHYFPAGAPQGPFIGAESIVQGWLDAAARLESRWTIDRMAVDEQRGEAVIEWTHFQPARRTYLRGDEWYRFDDRGLIVEIRAYYACPPSDSREVHELGEFDYPGSGYPISPPSVVRVRNE